MMILPMMNAIAIEMKIPPMMASAFPLLMYSPKFSPEPEVHTMNSDTATAAPAVQIPAIRW